MTSKWQIKLTAELGLKLLNNGSAQIPPPQMQRAKELLRAVIDLSDKRGAWVHSLHDEDGYRRVRKALEAGQLDAVPSPISATDIWDAAYQAKTLTTEITDFIVDTASLQVDEARRTSEEAIRTALNDFLNQMTAAADEAGR